MLALLIKSKVGEGSQDGVYEFVDKFNLIRQGRRSN